MFDFIFNMLNAFDWGFSFISHLVRLPYLQAVESMLDGGTVIFESLMHGTEYGFTFIDVPGVNDIIATVFSIMFGWTPTILGNEAGFGVCMLIGTFGNFLFVTVIHWTFKLIKSIGIFAPK